MQEIIVGNRAFFEAYRSPGAHYIIVGGHGNGIMVWNRIPKAIL